MRSSVYRLLLLLSAGSGIFFSGCYALIDDCMETEQCVLNECRSHVAWHRRADCYDCVEYRCDFASGFREGYYATAEQGDHCLPLTPPRKYWKHCYQNCEGRHRIDAWYEGYAHGMLAASQDGVYERARIPFYGLAEYGAMQNAAHTITLEEADAVETVPEPLPMKELPFEKAYEPVPAPPITGHSVPVPAPSGPVSTKEKIVLPPGFIQQYPDESSPHTYQPLGEPNTTLR